MEKKKDIQCYEKCIEKYPEKIKEIGLMYCELLASFTAHGCELTLPIKYVKEYIETNDIQCKGASCKMKNIAIDLVRNGLEPRNIELIRKSSSQHLQVAFYYLKNNGFIEFTGRSTYKLIVPTIMIQQLKNEVKSLKEVTKNSKKEDEKVFVNVINNLVTTDKKDKEEDKEEVKTVVISKPTSIMDKIKNDIINPLKEKIKNTEKQLIETTAINLKQREIIDDYRNKIFELEQIINTKNLTIQTQERTTETVAREGNQIIADQKNQINELENKVKELQGLNTLRLKEEITGFKKEFDEISEWVNEMSIKVKEV